MDDSSVRPKGHVPWRGLLIATGLGCVVYAALGVFADFDQLLEALSGFAPWVFVAALGLTFTNYVIRFGKWQYYLHLLGVEVERGHSFAIFLAGLLMSVTPAKVGEVLRSLLLAESHGIPVAKTAPIVISDRLSDMLALLVLMASGAAVFRQGWLVLVAGLGFCVVVVLAIQIPAFGHLLVAVARKTPLIKRGGDRIAEAYESLRLVGKAQVLAYPILLSVFGWFCECFAFYLIVHGFSGGAIDVFTATFIYSLATVAGAVAMLPGGLGATEASLAAMLITLDTGLDTAQAAAATVLIRLATLWFAVLVGLAALPVHRQLTAKKRTT
jgi:glycosyltransferase 2 family protein